MGWLDSVARFLDAIAWPLVVFLIVWLLQDPLAELIRGLRRVSYKNFGAEFGRKVQELETRADEAQLPEKIEAEESGPERLVAISPRAAVAEAWRGLEHALMDRGQELGYKETNAPGLAGRMASDGLISPTTASVLRDLRVLRNEAVHAREVDLSSAEALEYVDVAERVKNSVLQPST